MKTLIAGYNLAVPLETYHNFFQIPFVQTALNRYAIHVIIYDPIQEEIKLWKNYKNIDK
jgi:hypothetical protein